MNTISSMGDAATFKAIVERTITSFEDDQLTTIGRDAFKACTQLTSINLPAVTSIGSEAFYGCSKLVNVSLPVATSIGGYGFYACYGLINITLPSVTTIESAGFGGCSGLKRIDLPVVTAIKEGAFQSCSALTALIIRNTDSVASAGNNILSSSNNAIIYVPDDLVEDYKVTRNWATYFNRIKGLSELPNS